MRRERKHYNTASTQLMLFDVVVGQMRKASRQVQITVLGTYRTIAENYFVASGSGGWQTSVASMQS